MAQPILVGLIAAMAMLAASILTLVGVLWNTNTQFRLGKRSGDIAQQTAEDSRSKQLAEENKGLRAEMATMWTTEQAQRRQITDHEDTIAGLTAQLNVALRAQERAEGGLMATERTIANIYAPSEHRQEAQ